MKLRLARKIVKAYLSSREKMDVKSCMAAGIPHVPSRRWYYTGRFKQTLKAAFDRKWSRRGQSRSAWETP